MRERLEIARPYARAVAKDPKAREHALAALAEVRVLQRQFQGDRPGAAIVRLMDDQAVHSHLRSLSNEVSGIAERAKRRRRRGRWIVFLAGSSLVLLVNPVTGPRLRGQLTSLLGRCGEQVDHRDQLETQHTQANGDREQLDEIVEDTDAETGSLL